METQSLTVVDAMADAMKRRTNPIDIDTLHERVQELVGHKVARVTVQTQLVRNQDRFQRVDRGQYRLKKTRARKATH